MSKEKHHNKKSHKEVEQPSTGFMGSIKQFFKDLMENGCNGNLCQMDVDQLHLQKVENEMIVNINIQDGNQINLGELIESLSHNDSFSRSPKHSHQNLSVDEHNKSNTGNHYKKSGFHKEKQIENILSIEDAILDDSYNTKSDNSNNTNNVSSIRAISDIKILGDEYGLHHQTEA